LVWHAGTNEAETWSFGKSIDSYRATGISEFRENLLQASNANIMDSQETKTFWKEEGNYRVQL